MLQPLSTYLATCLNRNSFKSEHCHYWKITFFRGAPRKFKWQFIFSKMGTKIFYANRVILIVKNSSLKWGIPCIIFWIKTITQKSSYFFSNTLIWRNSLTVKVLNRRFNILNTMMKKESKSFTYTSSFSEIPVAGHGIYFLFPS